MSSENIYTHSVYWIHFPEYSDINFEGYVGVSINPAKRLKEHFYTSKKQNKNNYFYNILKKYPKNIIQTIIFQGEESQCYLLENELRPYKNIGWNSNIGGDKPPSKLGWKPSKETLEKRSKSLKNIVRTDMWKDNLSKSKQGCKNGMFGKKEPCSEFRKISIISSKNRHRVEILEHILILLDNNVPIRQITKSLQCSNNLVCSIKKDRQLYIKAIAFIKECNTG